MKGDEAALAAQGRAVLVGAGPGDPDLLTVRAVRELERAEVLLYDALIDPVILEYASADCERIDVGKRGDGSRGTSQDRIAELIILKARQGRYVVRLKGGDPFVFGRGGEEASALHEAGIPFEVVPGISSSVAVPAYAGIPVTDRRVSSSIAIVTGHRGKEPTDRRIDWEGLARSAETLVVLMGTAWLEDIVARVLSAGRDPETPAAVIAHGATPRQRVVSASLRELPARVRAAGLGAPAVIVIGEVVRSREQLAWYEARPLFGRRILVPAGEAHSGEVALALRRRGAEPLLLDLTAIANGEGARLRGILKEGIDAVALTSPPSAGLLFDSLAAPERELLERDVVFVCIDAATGAALEATSRATWGIADGSSSEAVANELERAFSDLQGGGSVSRPAGSPRGTGLRE